MSNPCCRIEEEAAFVSTRPAEVLSRLLPNAATLRFETCHVDETAAQLTVWVHSIATMSPCPLRATPTIRLHSHYERTLVDLPWAGYRVRLQLRVHKWFCDQEACQRRIFTERLPHIAQPSTTAHQGLLKDHFSPPIPLEVLGKSRGRMYKEEELASHFSHALFPRTTNRHGCVTLHSYHFYVERGLPQTRVLLWVYDEQLRAMFDHVVLAQYRCHYDWQTHQVRDLHGGVFYNSPFASPQGFLIPLDPQEAEVIKYPPRSRKQVIKSLSHKQLVLFELVPTA